MRAGAGGEKTGPAETESMPATRAEVFAWRIAGGPESAFAAPKPRARLAPRRASQARTFAACSRIDAQQNGPEPIPAMWTFPALPDPSVFIAAPGDLAYLREAVADELEKLRHRVADDHGIALYDWKIDRAEDGFRDWIPPQGQIPLPSDPNCRAVICLLGERIGTPMPADFDTTPLGPLDRLRGDGTGLVHPWRAGAEDEGGFALTGTVFEYLAALHANDSRGIEGTALERGNPPVLLLVVGDQTVLEDLDPLDANWGGHALFDSAEARFRESHGTRWRTACRDWEREHYVPQVQQLRNFLRYLQGRAIFPRIVADEEQARQEIRAFLVRELDLRVRDDERDPFKGLQAYDREDNEVFFGREAERREAVTELAELWADATRPNFYGVIGGSGVGKSSLARAGLVGHLCHQTSRGRYAACIVRPDELLPQPLPRLFELALQQLGADDADAQRARLEAVRQELQPAEALERLAQALAQRGPEWRLLLTFDQFEELLDRRADPAGAPLWAPVVELIALAVRHPSIGVVYTLQTNRSELIAHDPVLGPLWARGGNLRLAFPEHSLDEIIRKPFEFAGLVRLEPELVRTLRDRIVRFAHQSEGDSRGSLLPLVSLTLRRIFEASRQRLAAQAEKAAEAAAGRGPVLDPEAAQPRLGVADCEGLLEIEGAIAELADAAVQEARAASGAGWSDEVVGSLLRRLVRLGGASSDRLALPDAPMPSADAPRRLAQALIERRLLLREADGRIKLVHEAVLRHWPMASQWLDGERRLLRLAGIVGFKAEDWDSAGRDDASLARHGERDIDEAAELLGRWFDVLDGQAAGAADARIRDYALALLRVHPTPRRVVERSSTRSTHLHVATMYGELPLVLAHLAADPGSVHVQRADGRTPIFGPCHTGCAEVLRALIEAGADVDHADADGWQPLHLAANSGRLEALELLLAAGASLAKAGDGSVTSPVYLAASNGHAAVLRRLLELGADPAQPSTGGWTPMHAAAQEDHAEVIGLLAAAGASTEAQLQGSTFTPLHIAVLHDRAAAVRALAAAGAALDALVDYDHRKHWTPLHLAVRQGHEAVARELLRAGAAPEARDDLDQTPLALAVSRGGLSMASALLEEGARIDAPARDGHTCLYQAVRQGEEAQVRFLLRHGADPAAAGPDGRSPLQLAAMEGKEALLRLLLETGVPPSQPDGDGATALHHAARRGHAGVVDYLLSLPRVAIDADDGDGLTALHMAAEAGQAAIVELLLARGANVRAADLDGWTPLHLAAMGGHAGIVQTLLAGGAEVDAQAVLPAATPLHVAAELGHADVVELLVAAGADVEAATPHKPAALELATRYHQADAAAVLRTAGARMPAEPDDGPLSGLFNARGSAAPARCGAGADVAATGARRAADPHAPSPAQTRALTAHVGPMHYRWWPAPAELAARVTAEAVISAGLPQASAGRTQVEATGLSWYPQATLLRARNPDWPDPRPTVYFVLSAHDHLVRLPGISTPIHGLAASEGLALDASNVLGYLKFFCFFVRGEEGAFYILEDPDDPLVAGRVDATLRDVLRGTVRPASYEGVDASGRHICEAIVWYSDALFLGRFAITGNGMVEMLEDDPIAGDLPIRADAPIA